MIKAIPYFKEKSFCPVIFLKQWIEISKIQKTFDYIKNTYKPDEIKFEDIEDYSHKVKIF